MSLDQDCLVVTSRIIREVEKAGMRTLRSFDLDVVRSSSKAFSCPVHGLRVCSCQLVILLILTRDPGSITLILEGIDQQTAVYIDTSQGAREEQVDPSLITALIQALHSEEIL